MPQFFPHLNQGIASQYPIRRTTRYRTVVNANDLTTNLRATDPGTRRIAWWLRYQGLVDDEMAAIRSLFKAVHGPLDTFTFLDPEANLLAQSESLGDPVWQRSGGLTVATSAASPAGAGQSFEITTAPGQPAEIYQSVPAPASFHWLLSAYARADEPSHISLLIRHGSDERSSLQTISNTWKRYSFGGQSWSFGEGVQAGLRIGGGAAVEVAGLQLECQLTPSRYKPSNEHCGIHTEARFSQDRLRVTTIASNCHQVSLIVTAPLPG